MGASGESVDAKEAGRKLARLMERQLGFVEGHIDSVALRLFIKAYWSRVSLYSHAIHDDKAEAPAPVRCMNCGSAGVERYCPRGCAPKSGAWGGV